VGDSVSADETVAEIETDKVLNVSFGLCFYLFLLHCAFWKNCVFSVLGLNYRILT